MAAGFLMMRTPDLVAVGTAGGVTATHTVVLATDTDTEAEALAVHSWVACSWALSFESN